MKQCMERLYNGIVKENPTFVLMLGMCPTLAVTTSAINGLGMGLSTMVVLALSNLLISALRKVIPDKVRIPAYIVIIATFVTVVELLLHAYIPVLHESLGIYISLIVVNCIILGRAESYASKNKVLPSLFDGIGMGLGFTLALTLIGLLREFLGAGTIFGISGLALYGTTISELLVGLIHKCLRPDSPSEVIRVLNGILAGEAASLSPMGIMIMAPGAFFILAILTAIQNVIKEKGAQQGKDISKIQSGCNSDCMNCKDNGCTKRSAEEAEEADITEDEPEISVEENAPEENIEEAETESEEETKSEEVEAREEIESEDVKWEESEEREQSEETAGKINKVPPTEPAKVEYVGIQRKALDKTQKIDIVELEELLAEDESFDESADDTAGEPVEKKEEEEGDKDA